MQMIVLVLLAVVAMPRLWEAADPTAPLLPEAVLWAWGPPLAAAVLAGWFARRSMRALREGRPISPAVLRWRIRMLQWMCVWGLAAASVAFGWVDLLRIGMGDLPLLVEVAAMLPALLGFAACWWAWHPMEMALREALAPARGEKEVPPSRLRFVGEQFRNEFGLMAVPLLLALGAFEAFAAVSSRWLDPESAWQAIVGAGVVAAVAVLSPPLVVRVLVTAPLPEGPLRDRVEQVLRDNGVRLRGVRVWRTGGMVLNGVVLGLLPPLRYLMLTDGLLRGLDDEPLRAVVAHEAGHLRRHHLPWFAVVVLSLFGVLSWLAEPPVVTGLERGDRQIASWFGLGDEPDWLSPEQSRRLELEGFGPLPPAGEPPPPIVQGLAALAGLLLAGLAAGWVSRRFERQADTFAVQYLSVVGPSGRSVGLDGTPLAPGEARVQPAAVLAMCRALGRVAELNGLDPRQPSFRHGSIAFRQRHLVSLVSQPVLSLPIDRQVRAIKSASAATLALLVALEAVAWWRSEPAEALALASPPVAIAAGSIPACLPSPIER
jgi:STE24 endopeptidase